MDNSVQTSEWFSQERVPIEERYLWFEGHVAQAVLQRIVSGLPQHRTCHTAILFVGFAFADLEIGRCFEVIFQKERPENAILCQSRIVSVTQQFAKPFDRVPHGWKTICEVEFPDGVPSLIQNLPEVDWWYMNDECVCVCDAVTWEALKQKDRVAV